MASKRKHNDEGLAVAAGGAEKQARTNEPNVRNEYCGFSLQTSSATAPIIPVEDGSIRDQDFFANYVAKRRPCIINALPELSSGKIPSISAETLKAVAGAKMVQVERRFSTSEAFGQNRTASRQLIMTLADFLAKLEQKDGDLLYLSTQESTNEDKFQVPCEELLEQHLIAESVPWAGHLILHSCNLWIGKSQDGSSSGLHHDYHDNFYLLMRGSKRFRVFSPDCAPFMYTHGDIDKIHFNGRISYKGRETRADGVPIGMEEAVDDESDNDKSDDDEDEVVLGKGFDYKSDSESGDEFADKDDFDEIMRTDAAENGRESLDAEGLNRDETARPDSFSKIIVETIENKTVLEKDFPLFSACREWIIELKEGQTLYLPAGWFHEVKSTGGQNHTALNYWYHPPDSLNNFECPYQDLFWTVESKRD